jgi:hypothetical protein
LSDESRARWRELLRTYEFTFSETYALREHLEACDRARKFEEKHKGELAQRERVHALRWWRQLRFASSEAKKRPGHPGDREWSSARRQSAGGI